MSTDPTPTPVPTPGVHWASLLDFFRSLGSLPLWHVARGGGGLAFSAAKYAVKSLPYVASAIIIVAALRFMGCSPSPLPPSPVDPIPSGLTATLQAAAEQDTDADRAAKLATYSQVLLGIVPAARRDGMIATSGDFLATAHAAAVNAVGDKAIPHTKRAVADYLNAHVTREPATKADAAFWATAETAFTEVGQALGKVKVK